ncbi:hypothetical protein A0H81_10665 [Grifola frondosa]|uniref:DUF6534 domain-containing protein n=1 Tax=Grifola frondosa TaxID=5627 RepID=A0A1C7LZI7_GRIFR|nr:hypothetical protein A0H81_10665 [Grifola frondosa]
MMRTSPRRAAVGRTSSTSHDGSHDAQRMQFGVQIHARSYTFPASAPNCKLPSLAEESQYMPLVSHSLVVCQGTNMLSLRTGGTDVMVGSRRTTPSDSPVRVRSLNIMESAVPAHLPEINNTLGAVLIGSFISTMIYGLTTHQTYRYFRLYLRDRWMLKGMVIALWVLDTIHTVLTLHLCYFYLVTNYANPEALIHAVWSFKVCPLHYFDAQSWRVYYTCELLRTLIFVENLTFPRFYTHRLYLLGHRAKFLLALFIIFGLARLVVGVVMTTEAFILGTFMNFITMTWLICVSLALAFASDSLIAICLCAYLQRSRTGFKRTDSLIDILMLYTINTGLLHGFITLLSLICAAVMRQNLIYFSIFIMVSKMYTNSLLAVMNSRRSLLDRGMDAFDTGSLGMGNIQWEAPPPPRNATIKPAIIDVVVTTETFRHIDEESQKELEDNKMATLNETFDP